MDDSNYDEFGNWIGGGLSDSEDDAGDGIGGAGGAPDDDNTPMDVEGDEGGAGGQPGPTVGPGAVVLHEDKKYYPDAEEVYGSEVIAMLEEEDTMPITEPIIAPAKVANFDILEKAMPEVTFSYDFMAGLMEKPELVRNIAVIGHLGHGKTRFMDMIINSTHSFAKTGHQKDQTYIKELRYLDNRKDEQEREISVKASPMSMILPDSKGKSYLMNLYDTPGHPNFVDEATAAIRISDGVLVIFDVIHGLTAHLERMLKLCVQEGQNIVLVINRMDRLVIELKLPPADAYMKIRAMIEDVNAVLEELYTSMGIDDKRVVLSPQKGNVLFAAPLFNMCFSLKTFAQLYVDTYGIEDEIGCEFYPLLWGDIYYNRQTRKFQREEPVKQKEAKEKDNEDDDAASSSSSSSEEDDEVQRSFIEFCLVPLYKLIGHALGEERDDLEKILAQVGIYLTRNQLKMTTKNTLKVVGKCFFDSVACVTDACVRWVQNPRDAAAWKVSRIYSGDQTGAVAKAMKALDPSGPLMVHSVKNYHRPDLLGSFDVYARVMSGTLYKGDRVVILGENYSLADDEDRMVREVTHLWIYQGRYRVEVSHVPAGNWCLIGGIDANVVKTSTITTIQNDEEVEIFRPLKFPTQATMKIAIEPLNPSELPKMVNGLRKVNQAYPICATKVEESGEHVIAGTGELYLDCALHDLRRIYGELEIKVSDPIVSFQETVAETSTIKVSAETVNKHNTLYMICSPLEKQVNEDQVKQRIDEEWAPGGSEMSKYFQENYNWDLLAARSIWAFGPEEKTGANMLLNDCLPSDVNMRSLNQCKGALSRASSGPRERVRCAMKA